MENDNDTSSTADMTAMTTEESTLHVQQVVNIDNLDNIQTTLQSLQARSTPQTYESPCTTQYSFHTRDDVVQFVQEQMKKKPNTTAHDYDWSNMYDAVSLMDVLYPVGKEKDSDSIYWNGPEGWTRNMFKIMCSFRFEPPPIFMKEQPQQQQPQEEAVVVDDDDINTEPGESTGEKEEEEEKEPASRLPGVPSYEAFKELFPRGGYFSYDQSISDKIHNLKIKAGVFSCTHVYSQDKCSLAKDFLSRTDTFMREFTDYVHRMYQQLLSGADVTEQKAWHIISRTIYDIFSHLQGKRVLGNTTFNNCLVYEASSADRIEMCADVLWSTMQCHNAMKEMVDCNFENHRVVSSVLMPFMFERVSSMSVRIQGLEESRLEQKEINQKMEERMDEMERSLKRRVDDRGGGGGGGSGGGRGGGSCRSGGGRGKGKNGGNKKSKK